MTRLWWHSASDNPYFPAPRIVPSREERPSPGAPAWPCADPIPPGGASRGGGAFSWPWRTASPNQSRAPPRRGRDAKRAALGRGRRHASCAPCQPRTTSVAVCRMASTGRRSRPRWACPLSSARRPQTESDSASRSGVCCGRTPGLDSRPCRRRSTRADRRPRVRITIVPLCAVASRHKKNRQAAQGVGNHRAAATATAAPNGRAPRSHRGKVTRPRTGGPSAVPR